MRSLLGMGLFALGCTVVCAVGCDDETTTAATPTGSGTTTGSGTNTGVGGGTTTGSGSGTNTGVGGGTAGGGTGGAGGSAADCPASNPGDGTDCTEPLATWCVYGDDQCVCLQDGWACVTCPSTEPADASDCDGSPGMPDRCMYGSTQCVCPQSDEWNCAECPASMPTGSCTDERGLICAYATHVCMCQGAGNPQWNCTPISGAGGGGGAGGSGGGA